ncbi:PdaC/SigV domain-containing protein [Sphingomicrobium arenosum]|uniref:PdaC/SigV domain-containing protein n=1 Tax=Sphingomicrobium arenosum TaxID=2233861 RepID=UPI00223F6F97|nr:DUF4163 domain-containing protein [Sphingomicrobium arenosum]
MRFAPLAALPVALGLAACQQQQTSSPPPAATTADPPAPPAIADTPKAVKIAEKDNMVDFEMSWPAEAAAIPALDARFRKEAPERLATLREMAAEEAAMFAEMKRPFNGFQSAMTWTAAGQSERLLSLDGVYSAYMGGAHPNWNATELLWDRDADAPIPVAHLFGGNEALTAALSQRFCTDLDAQRLERRGEVIDGFNDCPPLDGVSVVPTDRDGNGRFERFVITAAPYAAGPYAEGGYDIDLPVDDAILDQLDAAFLADFETAS